MATSEFSYRYLKLRETVGLRFLVTLVGFASTMPLWCQSPLRQTLTLSFVMQEYGR